MDPVACFTRMMDALADEDFNEAVDALTDLQAWHQKNGWMPAINAVVIGDLREEVTRTGTIFVRLSGARTPD